LSNKFFWNFGQNHGVSPSLQQGTNSYPTMISQFFII